MTNLGPIKLSLTGLAPLRGMKIIFFYLLSKLFTSKIKKNILFLSNYPDCQCQIFANKVLSLIRSCDDLGEEYTQTKTAKSIWSKFSVVDCRQSSWSWLTFPNSSVLISPSLSLSNNAKASWRWKIQRNQSSTRRYIPSSTPCPWKRCVGQDWRGQTWWWYHISTTTPIIKLTSPGRLQIFLYKCRWNLLKASASLFIKFVK